MSAAQITGTVARLVDNERVEELAFSGQAELYMTLTQVVTNALDGDARFGVGDILSISDNLVELIVLDHEASPNSGSEILDVRNSLHLLVDFREVKK